MQTWQSRSSPQPNIASSWGRFRKSSGHISVPFTSNLLSLTYFSFVMYDVNFIDIIVSYLRVTNGLVEERLRMFIRSTASSDTASALSSLDISAGSQTLRDTDMCPSRRISRKYLGNFAV